MLGEATKASSSGGSPSASLERSSDPFPVSDAFLAMAAFALTCAGIGLFVGTILGGSSETLADFFEKNELEREPRRLLSVSVRVGAIVGLVVSGVYLAIRRRRGMPALTRASRIVLPLSLLLVVPSLFVARPWNKQPLPYLVGLTASVLLLEQLLRNAFRALPDGLMHELARKVALPLALRRWLPLGLVLAGSAAYAVYFSYYTILNHHRLNTFPYDLGINVNWCYNALHGQFWRSTVLSGPDGGHFLGNHAIFAMAFWLPFYALSPGAEVLLIFQATTVGLAATTLYLFAATQIPRGSAVVVAYAFLLFAPLHGPNFYDYHELMPPLVLHFLLYWAIARRKLWLVAVLVPTLWAFREDMAVGLVALGVFLVVTGARPKLGLSIAGSSLVWFCLIKFVIMPRYGLGWFDDIYKDLQVPGKGGYAGVVQTITINPAYLLSTLLTKEKLVYFLHFLGPLALLPLRRPALFLLAIPGFAFSLLTTGYAPTLSIGFQYTCHSIPYVFAATVLALRVIGEGEGGNLVRRCALAAVTLGVLSHSYVFGAVLQRETFIGGDVPIRFEISEDEQARYDKLRKMAAKIPPEASVSATDNEVPHVATHVNTYVLKSAKVPTDYVLINRREEPSAHVLPMLRKGDYRLIDSGRGLYLFRRGKGWTEATEKAVKELRLDAPKKKALKKPKPAKK